MMTGVWQRLGLTTLLLWTYFDNLRHPLHPGTVIPGRESQLRFFYVKRAPQLLSPQLRFFKQVTIVMYQKSSLKSVYSSSDAKHNLIQDRHHTGYALYLRMQSSINYLNLMITKSSS